MDCIAVFHERQRHRKPTPSMRDTLVQLRAAISKSIAEGQFGLPPAGKSFLEVPPADGQVEVVSTNIDLIAVADDVAFGVQPQHHRGFPPTMADRFDFD